MFKYATTQQLQTIWKHEKVHCSPNNFKAVARELFKRGELNISIFEKATKEQLWVILKNEEFVQTECLLGAFLELIKRNELKKHIEYLIKQLFGTITSAENATLFSVKDLTILSYQYGLDAVFEYNAEKNCVFIDLLNFVLINKINELSYINGYKRIKDVG
ncbi:hypothetical protein [Viridibacillus arvi]|uniref:hypothetical protein n=1 Tax=Viridibacillus arvi TaxID=263475 RepID=UPI0034CDC59F